jgi:hypothetical protein
LFFLRAATIAMGSGYVAHQSQLTAMVLMPSETVMTPPQFDD